jgi:hypothetical protein
MAQRSIDEVEATLQDDPTQLASFVLTMLRRSDFELVRGIDIARLRELVPRGVARAQSHGFTAVKDLVIFVGLMFEFGPGFDQQSEIQHLLRDNGNPPKRTMLDIVNQVSGPAWNEAERCRDEGEWFRQHSIAAAH